jgi:hypothetical protein
MPVHLGPGKLELHTLGLGLQPSKLKKNKKKKQFKDDAPSLHHRQHRYCRIQWPEPFLTPLSLSTNRAKNQNMMQMDYKSEI